MAAAAGSEGAASGASGERPAPPPEGAAAAGQKSPKSPGRQRPTALLLRDPTVAQQEQYAASLLEDHERQRTVIRGLLGQLCDVEQAHADACDRAGAGAELRSRIAAAQRDCAELGAREAELVAELRRLEAERADRERAAGRLAAELQGAQARVRRAEDYCDDRSEALASSLRAVRDRELRLRACEERLLGRRVAEARAAVATRELERERQELQGELDEWRDSIAARLAERRGESSAMLRELEQLTGQRDDLKRRVRRHQERRVAVTDRAEQLHAVRVALQQDLCAARQAKLHAEAAMRERAEMLCHEACTLAARPDGAQLRRKVEETLMGLKAAVINLSTDLSFVAEVALASGAADGDPDDLQRGTGPFAEAWRYVQGYADDALGRQPRGERWRPRRGDAVGGLEQHLDTAWPPAPSDAVEPLLAALKQLVVGWDMMHPHAKDQVAATCGPEIVANTHPLLALAEEAVVKHRELQRVRAEQELAAMEAAQERRSAAASTRRERLRRSVSPDRRSASPRRRVAPPALGAGAAAPQTRGRPGPARAPRPAAHPPAEEAGREY
eukprot:TRINITY_DN6073_c0_g1_i1.p1 TRINITY_DN6073_c0_g1~~TRINITY_DN6073_c0_g1_i1.p1  ORF type:complete len:583 (+),score=193.93 TRINITY_DN6073_c0_g1_i1:67-1749(+)